MIVAAHGDAAGGGGWGGRPSSSSASTSASTSTSVSTSASGSFASISRSLTVFTCDHVVPARNVHLACLSRGPTGGTLDFRHSGRERESIKDELGMTLLNVSTVVPGGVVVFLPSYRYEASLTRRWRETGTWAALGRRKGLHREPRESGDAERCLERYAREATGGGGRTAWSGKGKKGAILFCVVGGKMSEGINFSDDRARCVVVVGLPYPNITDPEMVEKMRSLDKGSGGGVGGGGASSAGRDYYRNLCLRAVNQSVGRAIRHGNDYAAVLLVDARYAADGRVRSGLPRWLTRGGEGGARDERGGGGGVAARGRRDDASSSSFGGVMLRLRGFYRDIAAERDEGGGGTDARKGTTV